MDATICHQPAHILLELAQVDLAVDGTKGALESRLHTDFELERIVSYRFEEGQGRVIEQVSSDLEMEVGRPVVLEDETENLPRTFGVVVKGAIDQFDLGHLVLHQQEQIVLNALHRVTSHQIVAGTEAETAVERTAA